MKLGPQIRRVLEGRRNEAKLRAKRARADFLAAHPRLEQGAEALRQAGATLFMAKVAQGDIKAAQASFEAQKKALDLALAETMAQEGLASCAFDPKPICPYCKDLGLVGDLPCACLLEIKQQLRPKAIDQVDLDSGPRLDALDVSAFSNDVHPDWYQGALSPRRAIFSIVREMQAYASDFSETMPSLYFYGKTGTGKTYLAKALGRSLEAKGYTVAFVHAPSFFDWRASLRVLEHSYHPDAVRMDLYQQRYRYLLEADFLILDDLGAELSSPEHVQDLLTLMESRKGPLLMTGNLDPEAFHARYDARVGSRLIGGFRSFELSGPDLRWGRYAHP